MGIPVDDGRFATNRDRVANWDELEDTINEAMGSDTVDAWMERMNAAGVPAGRINTMDQVYALPQLDHIGAVDEVDHPTAGHLRLPGSPLRWSAHPERTVAPPPRLGEHTEAVRREVHDT